MSSDNCGGFSPVSFKLRHDNSAIRHLFIKEHDTNSDTKPSDRTLFVINVPQFVNEKCIKFMYKECGEIERIYFHSKPKSTEEEEMVGSFTVAEPQVGYKVAYIVFQNPSGLKKALKCKELPPISSKKHMPSIGVKKWAEEYNSNFIDITTVQKEIDGFMSDYDAKVEEEKRKAKEMESVEDEDGWITVTKHSKKPTISRNETVSKKIIAKQNRANARKSLLNFYRCQLRETKMEHILEMRRKFEKDKALIAQMKANRKFKPF